MSGLL